MSQGNKGKVYLVGAGPGSADLITIRAAELLRSADCIIYDRLANPALLNYASRDAEIIHVPKRVGPLSFTQQQINKLLIEKAYSGQTVVRLKGGDPCIFGRATEEAAALAEAGIDFEIVPGITAGIAVAAYTGIMLTDRTYSSQVIFITGQEAGEKEKSNIDWHWLAKFGGTIVFYMAIGNLDFITSELIENGMEEETPVAVIADVTLPTQRIVKSSLRMISRRCKEKNIEPPAIMVIGAAAQSNPRLSWFTNKPLFGKTIVVARDEAGNADFAAKIISEAGNPLQFATIKIKSLTGTTKFLEALAKIADFDWVIFTSPNAVTVFFDYLHSLAKDARVFGSAKIAAIGSETAAKLGQFGIKADFVPAVFTSEELGRQLIGYTNLRGKKILLLRSKLASDELAELLQQAGAHVLNVPIYTAVNVKNECGWLMEKISKGQIDWLTFASPSSVRSFFEQIPADLVNSSNTKIASIGPVTSEQLKTLGLEIDAEAAEHTIDGLLSIMEKSEKRKAKKL